MRSIETHWRTLMPSGQAALHCALPLHASTQRAASSDWPPSVSARRPAAISTARDLSRPASGAVGHASTHLPHVVQRAKWSASVRAR